MTYSSQSEAADALAGVGSAGTTGATCDAAIVPRITYDIWRTSSNYCDLRQAEILFPSSAGWVTNRQSQCVQLAVEYAMNRMKIAGAFERLGHEWLTETGCSSSGEQLMERASDEQSRKRRTARRRRLQGVVSSGTGSTSSGSWRPAGRRMLTESGSGGGAAADAGSEDLKALGVIDFSGLLVVFGFVSIIVVILNECGAGIRAFFRRCQGVVGQSVDSTPAGSPKREASADSQLNYEEKLFDLSNINTDNEGAMIRRLLNQMLVVRNEMKGYHEMQQQQELERALTWQRQSIGDEKHNASEADERTRIPSARRRRRRSESQDKSNTSAQGGKAYEMNETSSRSRDDPTVLRHSYTIENLERGSIGAVRARSTTLPRL